MSSLLGTVRSNQLCKKVFFTTLLGGVSTQSHKNLQSVRLFCFSQLKYFHVVPPDNYTEGGFVRDISKSENHFCRKEVICLSINSIDVTSTF